MRLEKMIKVGRNDPCPCGSGKKFKRCHLGHEDELLVDKMKEDQENAAKKIASLPEVQLRQVKRVC